MEGKCQKPGQGLESWTQETLNHSYVYLRNDRVGIYLTLQELPTLSVQIEGNLKNIQAQKRAPNRAQRSRLIGEDAKRIKLFFKAPYYSEPSLKG